jgi:uncharacterized protein YjbJ (UPF0337 family)
MRALRRAGVGHLTDDDFDKIGGNYDMLVGKIQERYGHTRDDIERQLAQMDRESAA